ncbi:uncharacterized protein LOC119194854 [Pungitius pungitius]|uniref:uncharacterized protein LOC119194854 n=1 Tax=Pungitius pungitius TaxID=134920 RepID=UPI002E14DF27
MAIPSQGLFTIALLLTNIILETRYFSGFILQVHCEEEHFVSPVREKRSVHTDQWDYLIDVVVTAPDVQTFQLLRSLVNTTTFPKVLDNSTEISEIYITTVCFPSEAGFQCRCEDNFAWPYSSCVKYGACDKLSGGICKCIERIPDNGQSCQPISVLLTPVEYTVDVELKVFDIQIVDQLRILLEHSPAVLSLGPNVNVTHINITTVCYLNGTNFQCRCEEQYVWSYDNCIIYGACDEIIRETCGCINSIPTDGQYCQPQMAPPVVYEYLISIELNATDVAVIDLLRSISYPISITNTILVSDLNISTVCYPSSTGYQCKCEDQYRWSCDQCFIYGPCDNITEDTCGCISDITPDGQHCQSADQHNFTSCPPTTASPSTTTPPVVYEYLISIELNATDVAVIDLLGSISYPISITNTILVSDLNISTVCYPSSTGYQCKCEDQYRWSCDQCFIYGPCDNITEDTCGCISDIPPDGQHCQSADQHNFTSCPPTTASPSTTTPPVVYEYLISIELNATDVAVIDLLGSISYPISITNTILVSDLNISTVCYPSSTGYQCKCEDQYRWSCDQCFIYGPCDNITEDTCGCISDIPPDGQHCQSADQHHFRACPNTTTTPKPTSKHTSSAIVCGSRFLPTVGFYHHLHKYLAYTHYHHYSTSGFYHHLHKYLAYTHYHHYCTSGFYHHLHKYLAYTHYHHYSTSSFYHHLHKYLGYTHYHHGGSNHYVQQHYYRYWYSHLY